MTESVRAKHVQENVAFLFILTTTKVRTIYLFIEIIQPQKKNNKPNTSLFSMLVVGLFIYTTPTIATFPPFMN